MKSSDLTLRAANGTVYLQEAPFRVCEITPNVYLDLGESGTLQVQVLNRGLPAPAGVAVRWVSTSTSAPTQQTTLTDAYGVATLSVTGGSADAAIGQIDCYVASTDDPPPAVPDTMTTSYLWVRTLPPGDDIGRLPPTWDNVYRNVLFNWHAMAPCMDNWLRLDDPAQVAAYGPLIQQLTAKENFEAYRFMPVTRDLTAGQRKLLYAWLQSQPAAAKRPAGAAPHPVDHRGLSRAFRAPGGTGGR